MDYNARKAVWVSMYFTAPFRVSTVGPGSLWGMSYPGSCAPLQEAIVGLRRVKVTDFVCLIEKSEIQDLNLQPVPNLCRLFGLRFHHFPMKDKATPPDPLPLAKLSAQLFADLQRGRHIAVHCHAGIGRTGMLIECILGYLGHSLAECYEIFSTARGVSVPETQHAWMVRNWDLLTSARKETP